MKNSHLLHSEFDKKPELEEQLPKQWDYLSKRLTQVEKGLTILEKKYIKLQKKFTSQDRQATEFTAQLTEQILQIKSTMVTKQQVLVRIEDLQNQIKKSSSQQINRYIDTFNCTIHEKTDSIETKLRTLSDQTKLYIDRTVLQLKQLVKTYNTRQQNTLEKKLQKSSRQNSPACLPKNSFSKSKSTKKLGDNMTTPRIETLSDKNGYSSFQWLQKSRENSNNKQTGIGNSRVSYLREKLKQFQKINKKYEAEVDRSNKKQDKQQVMKKMRNYRNYLQQSESQLQPSSILTSEQLGRYPQPTKNDYPYQ